MQFVLEKPELERFVRDQVADGRYSSPIAVVEAALSRLMADGFAPGELDRLLAEGEESLRLHGPQDLDAVFKRLEEKSASVRARQ